MRHGSADALIERYVDGALEKALAREVEAHAAGCARCSRRIAAARRLAEALAAEPATRAPQGFAARVMDAVYREAFRGAPQPAAPRRMYRRLGLSFVLTAAVLAASLLIPSAAYPTLFRPHAAAGSTAVWEPGTAGGALVKGVLAEAGLTVRGALHPAGGYPSGSPGGSPR